MTREERSLKNLKQMCSDGRYLGSGSYVPLEVLEDFEVAIKALEQEPRKGKWIVKEESAYPCRGHMRCECDNCGYSKNAEYHDLAYGDTPKYIMPQFCEKCGNEKSNIVIYPTK